MKVQKRQRELQEKVESTGGQVKPLPKIDPKDERRKDWKRKMILKSESEVFPQAEKKFKQLESDEELARKVQEEWEAEEERNKIAEENAANERAYNEIFMI
ncbi:hypothetical protein Tco_0631277 [Tanacetum coccineum]